MGDDSLDATLRHAGVDLATVQLNDGTIVGPRPAAAITRSRLPRFSVSERQAAGEAGEADDLCIEGELARGGTGVVFEATQLALRRRVAVKRIRTDVELPWADARLLREAYAAGSVEHPNVVPVHGLGVDAQGRPLLVMKLIEGTPWADDIRPLFPGSDPAEAGRVDTQLRIFMQVCNAIAFAHKQGVLHRDIKPANVMIGSFGEVYVVDWGIAAATRPLPGIPLASSTEGLEGTPSYMAPEMARCDATALSEQTDVYLLGATLYELITGRKPHGGDTIRAALQHAHAGDPLQLPKSVPAELAGIVKTATAPAPSDRYRDVETLRDAVGDFLRHRASHELAAAAFERLVELRGILGDPPSATADDISTLAGEIRFGFRLALHEWPDNARAREGMAAFLRSMVEYELDRDNAGGAAALLAELHDAPSALVTRVREAKEAARRRAEEQSALLRAVDDQDFGKFFDVRIKATIIYSVVLSLAIGGLVAARMAGIHEAGYLDALVVIALFWATHLAVHRWVLDDDLNDINRRWHSMTMMVPPLLLAHFGMCAWAGIDLTAALALSMVVSAAVTGGAVMLIHRASLVLSAGLLLTGAAIYAWPPYRGISLGVGVVASFWATARVWQAILRRAGNPR